jgi:hypothetical protein
MSTPPYKEILLPWNQLALSWKTETDTYMPWNNPNLPWQRGNTTGGAALREDSSFVLREDGFKVLRE